MEGGENDVQFLSETINIDPISSWSNNMRRMYYSDAGLTPPASLSGNHRERQAITITDNSARGGTESPITLEEEPSRNATIELSDDERDQDDGGFSIYGHPDCRLPARHINRSRHDHYISGNE